MLPPSVQFANPKEIAVYKAVVKLGMCTMSQIQREIAPAGHRTQITNQIHSLLGKEVIHIVGHLKQNRFVYAPMYREAKE